MNLPLSPEEGENERIVVRPHHMERIARAITMKERYGSIKPADLEDYENLKSLLETNPDAEVIFVDNPTEPNCQYCFLINGCFPCREEYATEEEPRGELYVSKFDREVAEAQGWEFEKPYKLTDIVQLLTKQAAFRAIFYMCELDREKYELWKIDVRLIRESRGA